jgi:hypothetical protein
MRFTVNRRPAASCAWKGAETVRSSFLRSRIRSDSNSATIANTLNSTVRRGRSDPWIEPPRR